CWATCAANALSFHLTSAGPQGLTDQAFRHLFRDSQTTRDCLSRGTRSPSFHSAKRLEFGIGPVLRRPRCASPHLRTLPKIFSRVMWRPFDVNTVGLGGNWPRAVRRCHLTFRWQLIVSGT